MKLVTDSLYLQPMIKRIVCSRRNGKTQRQTAGFTLVELLVVIGIIAVLISVLLPALSRARAAANTIQCASSLRQFGIADQQYLNIHGGWHLPAYWGAKNGGDPGLAYNYNRTWPGMYEFRQSMGMPQINQQDTVNSGNILFCYVPGKWYCPAATYGLNQPSYYAPLKATVYPMNYSYGINVEGCDTDVPADCDLIRAPQANPAFNAAGANATYGSYAGFKASQVRRAAEKIFIADALWIAINEQGSGIQPGYTGKVSNYDLTLERGATGTIPGVGAYNTERSIAWRHNGKANVLFFDGHVTAMRKDEIYTFDSAGKIAINHTLWEVLQ